MYRVRGGVFMETSQLKPIKAICETPPPPQFSSIKTKRDPAARRQQSSLPWQHCRNQHFCTWFIPLSGGSVVGGNFSSSLRKPQGSGPNAGSPRTVYPKQPHKSHLQAALYITLTSLLICQIRTSSFLIKVGTLQSLHLTASFRHCSKQQ